MWVSQYFSITSLELLHYLDSECFLIHRNVKGTKSERWLVKQSQFGDFTVEITSEKCIDSIELIRLYVKIEQKNKRKKKQMSTECFFLEQTPMSQIHIFSSQKKNQREEKYYNQ